MKTKILTYSHRVLNKVVTCYADLEPINDKVYTYLYETSPYGSDRDRLALVLRVGDVYFKQNIYDRAFIASHDFGTEGARAADNYRQNVELAMQNGQFVTSLTVRVYQENGWDAAPLIQYRQMREKKRKAEEAEQKCRQKAEALARAERECERLRTAQQDLHNGGYIEKDDFIALCKQEGIDIPMRTHGTFNRSVVSVSLHNGLKYRCLPRKRKPNFDGCFKVIRAYRDKMLPAADKS